MKRSITQANYCVPILNGVVDGELPAGKRLVLMLMLAFSSLSVGTFSSADTRIESDTFFVEIDYPALQSRLEQTGVLVVRVEMLERIDAVTKVRLVVTNPTDSVVPVTPIRIMIGDGLSEEQDLGGGFGASFYTYLEPFTGGEYGIVVKIPDASKANSDSVSSSDRSNSYGGLAKAPHWFGWNNRYYFEAIRFTGDMRYQLTDTTAEALNPGNLFLVIEQKNLLPGESFTLQFDYASGSKSRQSLSNPQIRLEGLLLQNLWEWLRSLCFVVWDLLDFLYGIFANWGIAIVMLALVIRVITIPVTRYSLRHQERAIKQQARIGPLLKEIKLNYSGAQQSEKIVALYEDLNYEHLAPFKSMLGLFIQIPVFVALFNVLGDAWEISGQSFLWIMDLARSDRLFSWGIDLPYFGSYFNLLPVIMAAVTILSTWLASQHSGNEDAPTITLFGMGVLFFVLFYSFPAALVLYWLSSNFFQLVQQAMENWMNSRVH